MDRLRALSGTQRFALVLFGVVFDNIGRNVFGGAVSIVFSIVAGVVTFTALGLVELTVWIWHSAQRRLAS